VCLPADSELARTSRVVLIDRSAFAQDEQRGNGEQDEHCKKYGEKNSCVHRSVPSGGLMPRLIHAERRVRKDMCVVLTGERAGRRSLGTRGVGAVYIPPHSSRLVPSSPSLPAYFPPARHSGAAKICFKSQQFLLLLLLLCPRTHKMAAFGSITWQCVTHNNPNIMAAQIAFHCGPKHNVAVSPKENHKMAASATGAPDAAVASLHQVTN
jgi:hypothetical protein